MAYDIPDEIKYREKIIFNLDWKQLGYSVIFALLSFFSYNLIPITGELRFVVPAIIGIAGIGFIFLNLEDKLLGRISFFLNVRKADYNSLQGHKFFGVREVKENLIWLDDGSKIGMFKVQPINFGLLDNAKKKTLLANYKAFLNQLTSPIQILIKTVPVDLDDYFEEIKNSRTRRDLVALYANFKQFEVELMAKNEVKHRNYYVVVRYHDGLKMEAISNQLLITKENLESCGLICTRLEDADLVDFLMSYGGDDLGGEKPETKDEFRDMLTPSITFYPDHGIVNGEYHRIVKVIGYPRKVEDGWLGAFLCKNEDYDISIHLQPSSIAYTLVYLHNQIIQQTGDLYASTAKGTPNPALEIKKADTMRVYDSLYKGEEKMFSVSSYIDNKAATLQELDLLTEKCKSNLNAQLMVPGLTSWRTADAIKSTLPLANDRLNATREILSGALTATFPFIAAGNPTNKGILFAHEVQTLNPIFIDLDNQTNKHFFIIGVSGSGKSYAAKYFAVQQLFKEQTDLYILDPNGEYSGLCKALHGEVIEISKDSDSILNLFDLGGEDFGGKMLQLVSAFDIIMGGLNESQKALLSDAIINLYAKRGITPTKEETWNRTPPRFSDLKDVLEAMRKEFHQFSPQAKSLDALYRRVKMYCEGNVFGFLDQDTRVNANNGILCFDLSKLPDAIKPLMIFMVLGFIKRQISKDKEPKTVLIDEGWVLLRSKEAEGYILEFVKTSRKFNGSIGFISQEVEDLLQNSTGKTILNTASVKILMRQSPSSIGLVSSNLRLNEFEENYLLSAKKGHGLILTEDNSYCFFIEAPPKIHDLITTNPNEKTVDMEEPKTKRKIKINLDDGLYVKDDLEERIGLKLMENGHEVYTTRITTKDPYITYLVKVRQNESIEHAFLCQYAASLVPDSLKIKLNPTRDPDVYIEFGKKRICFEIETGKRYGKMGKDEMKTRFIDKTRNFDATYIITPNEQVARKYYPICKAVVTKAKLKAFLDSIFVSHSN